NLEEQKNTSELVNPYYQLLGNMDFSFVLIYLFPLIIIAICFNLFSEEKESGTWQLVSSQSQKPFRIIRAKILIRLVSVLLVLLLLFLIATVYLSISLDKVYGAFVLSSILYILFWFVAVWFVINLDKSSNENALILLSSWINLTIVIPAALNNVVENLYPIPEAYETTIDSRDGYHNKWDQPKEPTILKFKEHYPQFSKYEHPEDQSFGWFWYYAMQQMGDDEATEARQAMKDKLYARNRFTKLIGYALPSVHTQLSLNSLGKSDMSNYLNYMDALEQFHEDKRLMFYPMIFENVAISSEKWDKHKLEYFEDKRETEWIYLLLPILIWSGLLLWLSRTKMKEQLKEPK
ncbi:MAG: DUF3526 domain-containing protein, partial [Saprospiraceae bacterium]|nr:DUF3526 domain-containing protein [Saprospiraceae bacterium]